MKKAIFAVFLIISSQISARTYYVSPSGTDGTYPGRGTFSNPWRTWQYAFNNTTPGDTCYFRGGVYSDMYNASFGVRLNTESRNGTHSHPTCYFAYPSDWATRNYPILDCSSLTGPNKSGIEIAQASHLYIKGLHLANVFQESYTTQVRMFHIHNNYNEPLDNVNDITIENCVVHNGGGQGFFITSCDTLRFINCDAYNLCDSLSTLTSYDPGGWGTGFGSYSNNPNAYIYFYGCRAWNCSDQGFASNVKGYVEWDHCWSIHNGYFWPSTESATKGSGWKSEVDLVSYKNTSILQVYIHNSLAVDNEMQGFNTNDGEGDPEFRGHWHNNFSYRNGHTHVDGTRWGLGYVDFARLPSDTIGIWDHIYCNNLSYNNWGTTSSPVKLYPGDYLQTGSFNAEKSTNNYWDVTGTTVTNLDFISLDTTGLCGPREVDGSLPVTNFGKLASTSKLIDAGTKVGLPYNGTAPDIGWFETSSSSIDIPVYVSSSVENATPSRLEITYNLTLANIVPSASAFTVMVNSATRSVSSVSVSGNKVFLNLSSPVVYGNTITVAYTKPATNPIQTPSGGQAASLSVQNVTNNVATVSPVYVSSVIEDAFPSRLEITYNLTLANIVPAASAFTVRVNSAIRSVSAVTVSGTKVLLTLASPVVYDDIVTLAYTKPSINPLQTIPGGQAASFSARSVSNNCRLPVNQPPVASLLSPGKSSSFTAPATIVFDINAYDPDGSIIKVEIFNGSNKLAEINTVPYSFTWKDVPAGTYSITVVATDNLNTQTVSEAVTIVVSNIATSVNQLPSVSILSPVDGSSIKLPFTITLTADANDMDGFISKVEFFIGNDKIGESFAAPYTVKYNCLKSGTYEIIAIATDNQNAVSSSSSVMLFATYDNDPDPIILYPNPNDGKFTINLSSAILAEENKFTIATLKGNVVYTGIIMQDEYTRNFDLTYLDSGVYVLTISNDQIVYTKKFLKK